MHGCGLSNKVHRKHLLKETKIRLRMLAVHFRTEAIPKLLNHQQGAVLQVIKGDWHRHSEWLKSRDTPI